MNQYIQIAIDEAKAAQAEGNYPYGSVLLRGKEIVAVGRNHVNTHNDPTSHAEIEVIRAAGLQESYVGASWDGCEASQEFMESKGVKITVLELEECRELLRNSG